MNPADKVRALTIRKQAIEAEIETHLAVLSSNSSTLRSPLVDPDGFPRSDIDIYAVRGARVRIIELRNDLNAVMDEIGKALESVYDPKSSLPDVGVVESSGGQSSSDDPLVPFAKVDGVAPNSPAATSVRVFVDEPIFYTQQTQNGEPLPQGLQREDLIVQFGHLTRQSFDSTSLSRLTDLVAASENASQRLR
jgi:26S proteasome non-ATPase regulatory subunit 9